MSEVNENLNQGFQMHLDETEVITVPIDTTLTQEGEAADAKAVGDALALKADASSVNTIDVNGEEADNQGHIILYGTKVPTSSTDSTPVSDAIAAAAGRTATDIPMSTATGAQTIAQAISGLGAETAATLPMSDTDSTTVKAKIDSLDTAVAAAVKSVNGTTPGSDGNVVINEVPFAGNLTSDQSQATAGEFTLRTTGGSRSVGSGSAQLQEIRGTMLHTGVVQESLTWDTQETSGITVSIDRDTFVEYVTESGEITLTYNSGWKNGSTSVNLTDYGITVTGSPNANDKIVITYVAGDRGTITPATPTAFRATGWNLFNSSTGYARVADYGGAYHIGGSYTEIKFSTTLSGTKSALTVESGGHFTPPGDGYVWVTGGDATSTYITPEWTDWVNGPDVAFAAYSENTINLSTVMSAHFENGLLAVGTVYDSINIDQGKYYSRIARIAYDEDDLQDLIDAGIAYDADENYIYYVKTTADSGNITLNGNFSASDHGIEVVDGTEVAPYVVILYGQNLKAKLTNDVVMISQQTLTAAQKQQVLDNIGAASAAALGIVGSTLSKLESSAVSVANATNTHLTSITLNKGVYIVQAVASYAANGTGLRQIYLSLTRAGSLLNRFCTSTNGSVASGAITRIALTSILEIGQDNTSIYLVGNQTSGSTLSVDGIGMQAVRIK